MNEETKKPLEDSIRRMTEALKEVRRVASSALDRALHDTSDGLKWQRLSTALGDIRHRLGPCAIMRTECWHKAKSHIADERPMDPAAGTGAFFTPKAAIDAIMANPQIDIPPADEPIDPKAPKLVRGDLPPGADGVEPGGARVQRARCERRVEARCDHIGDLICQLLDIKCYCARGDADLEALDAAIRFGLKRHRNQVAWLVRKRNGPTIGEVGSEAPLPSTNYQLPTGEEAQS